MKHTIAGWERPFNSRFLYQGMDKLLPPIFPVWWIMNHSCSVGVCKTRNIINRFHGLRCMTTANTAVWQTAHPQCVWRCLRMKTCRYINHNSATGQCELGLGQCESLQPAAGVLVNASPHLHRISLLLVDCMAWILTYSISQEICTRFFALLCFVVVIHWLIFAISIRLTSLALWQSNDCPSASKATLMNMDKYFMWIHYERLQYHNKAKHNKTVCIFLGIYCKSHQFWLWSHITLLMNENIKSWPVFHLSHS